MAKNGWTEERRRRQAEIIRQNKPWEKSTGPKTQAGKSRSKYNALKHGEYCAEWREVQEAVIALLKANREFLKLTNQLIHLEPRALGFPKARRKRTEERTIETIFDIKGL